MNTQGIILEKKTFTTGCGVKLNYTFVPAICTVMYQKYYSTFLTVNAKVQEQNKRMNDPEQMAQIALSPALIEEFNKEAEQNALDMQAVNDMGDEVILLILSKNKQKYDNIDIDFINTNMTTTDKVSFLSYSVIGEPENQKKNINK